MKRKIRLWLVVAMILASSCQNATITPSSTPIYSTATLHPSTETPTLTPTLIPVSAKSLAGLIISSPIIGSQYEDTGYQPAEKFTINGLGIINSEGRLIKFSDAGVFESYSPSGIQIVYQHGFEEEFTDYIDNLYVYNIVTRKNIEIVDNLEQEGGKTVISWSPDEKTFIYYNDYLTILFEAYGYFGTRQLLKADVETGKTTLLIGDGYQFDVNPDQSQIAYTTGELLSDLGTPVNPLLEKFGCFQPHIFDIATASSHEFDVHSLNEKPVCMGYPKWSPDGKKIAWMGFFGDNTFRPIIFDLQNNLGRVYAPLDQSPTPSVMPTSWYFGEPPFGGRFKPAWVDHVTFWTPSYEVNVETGHMSTPRILEPAYDPWSAAITSPDGLLDVSLNDQNNTILIQDKSGNLLGSFLLDDLYDGPRQEVLTSSFFMPSRNWIVGWSPFSHPPNIESH